MRPMDEVGGGVHSWPRSRSAWLLALTLVLPLTATGSVLLNGQAAGSQPPGTASYTDAQAERAPVAFSQSCSRCHTLAAQGDSPLSGEKFWEGFAQKTVEDLLSYVRTNMPNGNGARCQRPREQFRGAHPEIQRLPHRGRRVAPETVAGVRIIPKNGPGELPANTLDRMIGCLARDGNEWVLTSATAPVRVERIGVGAEDASRPLGDRTTPLKSS